MKPPSNDNTSSEAASGPPDSHEAMNNREEFHPKVREKRSYEFLMGLINNNSRYEVTRVDPEHTTQKPKLISEVANASELLLELMVKIASQPDQWNKVHNLLQTIDQDLKTSKDVVTKLRNFSNESESNNYEQVTTRTSENIVTPRFANEKNISESEHELIKEKKWPVFDMEDQDVQIVNKNYTAINESRAQNISEKSRNRTTKSAYPKNFTYHRVTGRPDNTSKNPKAYIAVSVIAPKSTNTEETIEEDVTLEKELHQLKPWSHMRNPNNVDSLRSKSIIHHQQNNNL